MFVPNPFPVGEMMMALIVALAVVSTLLAAAAALPDGVRRKREERALPALPGSRAHAPRRPSRGMARLRRSSDGRSDGGAR